MPDLGKIQYGARVIILDHSGLHGELGLVIKVGDNQMADVLIEKEVVWPVRIYDLELAS